MGFGISAIVVMACWTAVRIRVKAGLAHVRLRCCCLLGLGSARGVKGVFLCLVPLSDNIDIEFL